MYWKDVMVADTLSLTRLRVSGCNLVALGAWQGLRSKASPCAVVGCGQRHVVSYDYDTLKLTLLYRIKA